MNMRLLTFIFLVMASVASANGPVLYRDTTTKVTSRMAHTYDTATGDVNTNGNTITGLATPVADSDVATKSYVDASAGTNPISENLAIASAIFSPSAKSKHITLFPPTAALSPGVKFNHSFNSLNADFAVGTAAGANGVGSPVVTGGVLDLTGGNANFEAHSVRFNGDNMPDTFFTAAPIDYFHIRLLFRPNWSGSPSSNVSLLTKVNGAVAGTPNVLYIYIDTNGSLVWGGRSNLDAVLGSNATSLDVGWQKGELYQVDVNWAWNENTATGEGSVFLNGQFWGIANNTHEFSGGLGPIILGGENGALANDEAPYFSNHTVEGLTVWSSVDGTDVRPNFFDDASPETTYTFTPTYDIDGSTSGTETINTITGTFYEAGDTLTLINGQDGETFILTESAPISGDSIDLTSRFTPKKLGDQITLEYTGTYWIEANRHFVADGNNPIGSDVIVLAQSSSILTALGGTDIELYGSISALPVSLVLMADYSDGSLEPDFSLSGRSIHFDQGDFVVTDETPAVIGGILTLNPVSPGFDRSAITYIADGGSAARKSNQGTVRLILRTRYAGTPADDVMFFTRHRINYTGTCLLFNASGQPGCRYTHRLMNRTANGTVRLDVYNNGTTYFNLAPAVWVPVADTDYEIEYSWNYSTGNLRLFVDGILTGTNATLVGADYTWGAGTESGGVLTAYTLGGVGVTQLDHSIERSNHSYKGFAVFNTEQHTGNYSATGLPGASLASENITTIVSGGYYNVGSVVRFYAREASRFSFADSGIVAADLMNLSGTWSPTVIGEWIDLRLLSAGAFSYWEEIARGP